MVKFDALHPEGCRFGSRFRRHVGTFGKSFTRSTSACSLVTQHQCCSRERLWVVADLNRNIQNECCLQWKNCLSVGTPLAVQFQSYILYVTQSQITSEETDQENEFVWTREIRRQILKFMRACMGSQCSSQRVGEHDYVESNFHEFCSTMENSGKRLEGGCIKQEGHRG